MGRHRRYADSNNGVSNGSTINNDHNNVRKAASVQERLGLTKQVCMDCNSRAPELADSCLKCGSSNLRQKKSEFTDG